jgi:hypothetical protein
MGCDQVVYLGMLQFGLSAHRENKRLRLWTNRRFERLVEVNPDGQYLFAVPFPFPPTSSVIPETFACLSSDVERAAM